MLNRRRFALALVVITMGCAHRSSAADSDATSRPPRDSDVITAQELADPAVAGDNALDAVRRLRPRFLTSRGRQSVMIAGAGSVLVSTNGGPLRGLSDLGRMRTHEILEIRFLGASEAMQRFG
ncbi:MAG: hypothetical protein ABMA00_17980, partial [Gemmatimonas sp.]